MLKLDLHNILNSIKRKPKIPNELTSHTIFRIPFFALAFILLILMPVLSADYGITGDEHTQHNYGDKLLKHKISKGENQDYLKYKNLKYYGGLFDYTTSSLNPNHDYNNTKGKKTSERRFGDIYEFRHFINALFGFLMIFFAGLLAKELTGNWRVAFFVILFLALSPRIFGHSMNNPKDIPFAAAFTFTLFFLFNYLRALPKPNVTSILFLGLGIAAAINVRVGGILLIAYFILFTLLYHYKNPKIKIKHILYLLNMLGLTLLISAIGYFGGQVFWPWARQAPLTNPWIALGLMENFDIYIKLLFEGKRIWSDSLPWYYLPKWMIISSPLFVLLGLLITPALIFISKSQLKNRDFILIVFAGVFPIVYAIVKQSTLYDGMRHFIFVYPIFVIIAACAWDDLISFASRKKATHILISILLAILLFLPAKFMVKNHPYQYVYFNELIGGIKKANTNYETDYWTISMKGLSDWFVKNIPEAQLGLEAVQAGKTAEQIQSELPEIIIGTNCGAAVKHYLQQRIPNLKVHSFYYHERERQLWDYGFWSYRNLDKSYIQNAWPPADIIYEEKVDNITIGAITKRRAIHDYNGYHALINKDYAQSINYNTKAIDLDPKNDLALVGLAIAYRIIGELQNCKSALDKLLALNPENPMSLDLLGQYYMSMENAKDAKAAFQKAIQIDKKYKDAYFNLAKIEVDPARALSYLELYFTHEGKDLTACNFAISLAQKLNNPTAMLYFEAEKALWSGDPNTAAIKMNQALKMNPYYNPAIQMKKEYMRYNELEK